MNKSLITIVIVFVALALLSFSCGQGQADQDWAVIHGLLHKHKNLVLVYGLGDPDAIKCMQRCSRLGDAFVVQHGAGEFARRVKEHETNCP